MVFTCIYKKWLKITTHGDINNCVRVCYLFIKLDLRLYVLYTPHTMKKDIHPKYNEGITLKCACGFKTTTGSTKDKIEVEVCFNCHPFYTGDDKIIDSAGRVEKFKTRAAKAVKKKTKKKDKKETTKSAKKKTNKEEKKLDKK